MFFTSNPDRRIRIEPRHITRNRGSLGTEILLVDGAILVDDERHDSRVSVSRWEREHSEAAGHVSIDEVVLGAAGARSLLGP